MRKTSTPRLTLHRETVRNLAAPEMSAAQGGINSIGCPTYTLYRTCGITGGCPTQASFCGCETTATRAC
jgi:hypothetical protein